MEQTRRRQFTAAISEILASKAGAQWSGGVRARVNLNDGRIKRQVFGHAIGRPLAFTASGLALPVWALEPEAIPVEEILTAATNYTDAAINGQTWGYVNAAAILRAGELRAWSVELETGQNFAI